VIKLVGCPGVPREVRQFVVWLAEEIEVDPKDQIRIDLILPPLHGFYMAPQCPYHQIHVVLNEDMDETLDTIAHEFVHYEQIKAGKPITERGVRRRAAALVKRWARERDGREG
jgi:hypothetical protein